MDCFNITYSRAPELYKLEYKEEIDPKEKVEMLRKADVYAFGVLISEILSGVLEVTAYKGNQKQLISATNVIVLRSLYCSGVIIWNRDIDLDTTRQLRKIQVYDGFKCHL